MATLNSYRFVGPTTAITVTASSSTSVTITPTGNDQTNYCAFLNASGNPVAITITPVLLGTSGTAPAAVLPTGGNTSKSFILGINMSQPTVLAVPPNFAITTIGTAGTTLYVMPVIDSN
jgi:hypothetical protein